MENKIKIFDLVVTCILIVIVVIGVVNAVSIKASEESGNLTLDNYKEYLTANWGGFITAGAENNCSVRFSAVGRYKLTDVEVTFSFESKLIEKRQFSVSFSDLTSANPYFYDVRVLVNQPSYGEERELLNTRITVISISGTYRGRK